MASEGAVKASEVARRASGGAGRWEGYGAPESDEARRAPVGVGRVSEAVGRTSEAGGMALGNGESQNGAAA